MTGERTGGRGLLRLFAALELPAEAVRELEAFRARADPEVWRPVASPSLHITLAFLGATDPALVVPIGAALEAAAGRAGRVRLALGDALLLPPRRARVLCAAVSDPDGTLAALQARVSEALAATGAYAPEARPFRAHVTVARLRPRTRPPRTPPAGPAALAFTAGALTLFASRLRPGGARYERLKGVVLRPIERRDRLEGPVADPSGRGASEC